VVRNGIPTWRVDQNVECVAMQMFAPIRMTTILKLLAQMRVEYGIRALNVQKLVVILLGLVVN
jgi:hypothetical protein